MLESPLAAWTPHSHKRKREPSLSLPFRVPHSLRLSAKGAGSNFSPPQLDPLLLAFCQTTQTALGRHPEERSDEGSPSCPALHAKPFPSVHRATHRPPNPRPTFVRCTKTVPSPACTLFNPALISRPSDVPEVPINRRKNARSIDELFPRRITHRVQPGILLKPRQI
jgi:hypothetical protein